MLWLTLCSTVDSMGIPMASSRGGGLQLLEAPELPGHVMHAGLGRLGRLTRGQLEQGQVDAPGRS